MGTLDLSTDSRLTHFSIWFGRFPFRVQNKAKSGWVMGSCVRSAARQVQSNVENALIRIRFKLICISQWPRKPTREAQLVSSWVELISSAGCAIQTKSWPTNGVSWFRCRVRTIQYPEKGTQKMWFPEALSMYTYIPHCGLDKTTWRHVHRGHRGDIGKVTLLLSLSEIELRYKRLMASISDSIAVYWLPNDVRAGHW